MSSLNELRYIGDSSLSPVEQYNYFLTNVLGAEHNFFCDPEQEDTVFWLDESKTCGFQAYSSMLHIVAKNKENSGLSNRSVSSGESVKIAYQTSLNGSVLYLRDMSGSYDGNAVAAKDSKGVWHIFGAGNYVFNSNGKNAAPGGITPVSAFPFTAVKMPDFDGGTFDELYKVIYATSFEKSSTVIASDGKPYRIVSASAGSATVTPCFAFPVSDN